MATTAHVILRGCRLNLSVNIQITRGYARKIDEEAMTAYDKFRKDFSAYRRQFRDELKDKASGEDELKAKIDRIDKENEKKVLENIAIDDVMLELKRNAINKTKERKMKIQRSRGDAKRKEMAENRKASYIQQIEERTEELKDFITFDNLEEKVQEAVDNIHTFTYALDQSGKRAELTNDIYFLDYDEFTNYKASTVKDLYVVRKGQHIF